MDPEITQETPLLDQVIGQDGGKFEKMYTIPEAAKLLRVSPWTLWDALKEGKATRTRVLGKTFMRESEVLRLIVDSRDQPIEAEPPAQKKQRRKIKHADEAKRRALAK